MFGNGWGVSDAGVPLTIAEDDRETGVDGSLAGIRQWPIDVVQGEAQEQAILVGDAMIQAQGKLIAVRNHARGCGKGPRAIWTFRIVGQWIAGQDAGDLRIHGDYESVTRKSGSVQTAPLIGGGYRDNLRAAQDLTEALVFRKVVSLAAAVVQTGHNHRASVGEPEFIALERRDAPGIGYGAAIEKIACIERGVAQEFKDRAMHLIAAGFGDDVGKASRSLPVGCRQNA